MQKLEFATTLETTDATFISGALARLSAELESSSVEKRDYQLMISSMNSFAHRSRSGPR